MKRLGSIVVGILVLANATTAACEEPFFEDLAAIYRTVLVDSMPDLKGKPFSMALGKEMKQGASLQKLPTKLWSQVASDLAERGVDSSGYVSADRVEVRKGAAFVSGTETRIRVWTIVGLEWQGGDRVKVSKMMLKDGLDGQHYTAVLEKKAGVWVIVSRINQGVAMIGQQVAHANAGSASG